MEALSVTGAGARCCLVRRGWRSRACSARRRGAAFQWLSGRWGDGARLFAEVGRWEPMGRSWNEKSSLGIRRNFIPTRIAQQQSKLHRLLCSLVPQKCSGPVWIQPSPHSWPCFGQEVELDEVLRSLPTCLLWTCAWCQLLLSSFQLWESCLRNIPQIPALFSVPYLSNCLRFPCMLSLLARQFHMHKQLFYSMMED